MNIIIRVFELCECAPCCPRIVLSNSATVTRANNRVKAKKSESNKLRSTITVGNVHVHASLTLHSIGADWSLSLNLMFTMLTTVAIF